MGGVLRHCLLVEAITNSIKVTIHIRETRFLKWIDFDLRVLLTRFIWQVIVCQSLYMYSVV